MTKYSNFSTDYKKSKGRIYPEEIDPHRNCFMRDRDRIIHSSAFRRLKYKTQVFVYHHEDYYRTRLSHSLEVSQLARSLSKVFNVNDDLAESISLSHDLGHTPFGHAGEDELNEKLKKFGGFNHNFQTIKILTSLEKKYINFDGLNLTYETLEGILKHNGPLKENIPNFIQNLINHFKASLDEFGSFESQIATICDDVAYNNNDIDDGLYAKLFTLEELEGIELIKNILNKIKSKRNRFNESRIRYELVRGLIREMLNDIIKNTKINLQHLKISSSEGIKKSNISIVNFSEQMSAEVKKIKKFLKKNMYNHSRVKTMTLKARKIISNLYDLFCDEPDLLPNKWRNFNNDSEKKKTVADYISGMTDKYAIEVHKKHFNLYEF